MILAGDDRGVSPTGGSGRKRREQNIQITTPLSSASRVGMSKEQASASTKDINVAGIDHECRQGCLASKVHRQHDRRLVKLLSVDQEGAGHAVAVSRPQGLRN